MTSILFSPQYRFYNSAKRRNLPLHYIKQESNGFEYFIYNDTIYIFPDFNQIDLNEEETKWQVDYDGNWNSFDECYANLLAKLERTYDYPVKLLVERNMFPKLNLNDIMIPECIFITWNYENTFENEDSALKMVIPKSSKELYDMMLQTPDLCGKFELAKNNGNIVWNVHKNIRIQISVNTEDCYLGVNKMLFGRIESSIMHWHPTIFEIYDEVCKIGKRGNVLVLRSTWIGSTLLYAGTKDNCPYLPNQKYLFGKYYYLEANCIT